MAHELISFMDAFSEAAGDSNHSAYSQLAPPTEEDIRAAAEALWSLALEKDVDLVGARLDEGFVVTALLAQAKRWMDEGELVSTEFEEYWDATDGQKLSSGLMEWIKRELTQNFLAEKKRTGFLVVNNRYGIWLFREGPLQGLLDRVKP